MKVWLQKLQIYSTIRLLDPSLVFLTWKWVWMCVCKLSFLENIFSHISHWNLFSWIILCLFSANLEANFFKQTLHWKSSIPSWIFKWVFNLYIVENSFWHIWHKVSLTLFLFSTLGWPHVFKCLVAIWLLENFLEQLAQGWFNLDSIPVWVFSCNNSESFLWVTKEQFWKVHCSSLSAWCVLSCLLRSLAVVNNFLQVGQG